MAITKAQKVAIIEDVTSRLNEAEIVIITKNNGLTVAQVTQLRNRTRAAGASYKVAKNRLVKLVLPQTRFSALDEHFKGPTAITTSKDPVGAAKAIVDFAKTNEQLEIIGGAYGAQTLDAKSIQSLASLPSLDELRSRLIAMINTPATRIAGVVQAPAGQLARVVGAYSKKDS